MRYLLALAALSSLLAACQCPCHQNENTLAPAAPPAAQPAPGSAH
jgi:hypothetical protein